MVYYRPADAVAGRQGEAMEVLHIGRILAQSNITAGSSPVGMSKKKLRGGAEVARKAHNLEVAGSNPAPATQNATIFKWSGWRLICKLTIVSDTVHIRRCTRLRWYGIRNMSRNSNAVSRKALGAVFF